MSITKPRFSISLLVALGCAACTSALGGDLDKSSQVSLEKVAHERAVEECDDAFEEALGHVATGTYGTQYEVQAWITNQAGADVPGAMVELYDAVYRASSCVNRANVDHFLKDMDVAWYLDELERGVPDEEVQDLNTSVVDWRTLAARTCALSNGVSEQVAYQPLSFLGVSRDTAADVIDHFACELMREVSIGAWLPRFYFGPAGMTPALLDTLADAHAAGLAEAAAAAPESPEVPVVIDEMAKLTESMRAQERYICEVAVRTSTFDYRRAEDLFIEVCVDEAADEDARRWELLAEAGGALPPGLPERIIATLPAPEAVEGAE